MKKTPKAHRPVGDLRAEYAFDYTQGRKNRFAAGGASTVAVVFEPDVARVFGSSAEVNRLLRSVIKLYRAPSPLTEDAKRVSRRMEPTRTERARLIRGR